jgi:hypothetical protein
MTTNVASNRAIETWRSRIDLSLPFWTDFRKQLKSLGDNTFPTPSELSSFLPRGLSSKGGSPIRFVPAGNLPGVEYEKHIFSTGEVSTREANWHDLFNALAWCRLPCLKVAMNAVHFSELGSGAKGSRGKRRDALTLFDESGVIVCSSKEDQLQALARHDWGAVFQQSANSWEEEIRVFVVGHALLEKFLDPYKSITAHALLLCIDEANLEQPREVLLPALDEWVANSMLGGQLLDSPSCLSPIPLMGVPGWWPGGKQDDEFYADQQVFRPMREGASQAPILACNSELYSR